MRIGVTIPATGMTARAVHLVVEEAERLGYDAVWVPDLPVAASSARTLDPVALLATATARTQHLGLGASLLTDQWPLDRLQRALSSLAALSDGRLTIALATGRLGEHGVAAALDALAPLRAMHRPAIDGTRHPLRALVAGDSPVALVLAGERADGWCAPDVAPDRLRPWWERVQAFGRGVGRETSELALVVRAGVRVVDDDLGPARPPYVGSVRQVAADLAAAHKAGADGVVLALAAQPTLDAHLALCARVTEAALAAAGATQPG